MFLIEACRHEPLEIQCDCLPFGRTLRNLIEVYDATVYVISLLTDGLHKTI